MKVLESGRQAKMEEPERMEGGSYSLAFGDPVLSVSSPHLSLAPHELSPVWRTKGVDPHH